MTSTKKDLVLKYYENNIGGRKDFIDTVGFSPEEKVRLLRAYDSGLSNLRKMVDNSVTIAVEEFAKKVEMTFATGETLSDGEFLRGYNKRSEELRQSLQLLVKQSK